jgi:hypothetical protein
MKSRSKLAAENARLWSLAKQLAESLRHYRGADHNYLTKSKALVRFARFQKNRP